jgi:alkyl hydroperoxide reductase subunit D
MSIDALKNKIPEYAKDIKLNLSSLANDETLNEQQLWGTFLASALATGNADVIAAIETEAAQKLSADGLNAAKAAASIMAMNNVYYKFTGWMEDYRSLPAKLRMNVIGNPGVSKVDFELWSLAVSAVNGCKYCVMAHEKTLREHQVSLEQVQTAVRVAATVRAVAATLAGEEGLSGALTQAA